MTHHLSRLLGPWPYYLCLDFGDWPTQRLQVQQPELRGRMIVLSIADRRNGTLVAACCARALQVGIQPGMPLAEATSLLQASSPPPAGCLSGLHIQPADPEADQAGLQQVARGLAQFATRVGRSTDYPPGSLFLEVGRTASRWGGLEPLAQAVVDQIQRQGYRAALGGAWSPSAAWAIARFGPQAGRTSPTILPSHLLHETHRMDEALESLPIESLRLEDATLQLLKRLGIVRLGQLWQLPRHALAPRFGPQLLKRLDQLLGLQPELIETCSWLDPFQVELEMEYPAERRECLERILRQLLGQLASQLRSGGQGLVVLEVCLTCGEGEQVRFEVGVYRPTAEEGLLEKLLQLRLESLVLPGPVRQVRLQAAVKVPLVASQERLWNERAANLSSWEMLINRLSNRLGSERVVRPSWVGGILPERACRWISWAGQRSRPAVSHPPGDHGPARPLWLCQPPQPVQVMTAAAHGPPVFLWEGTRRLAILHTWGPERLETGWWRGVLHRRDYYRIELEDGRRWWIFRRRTDGQWLVHGYFG